MREKRFMKVLTVFFMVISSAAVLAVSGCGSADAENSMDITTTRPVRAEILNASPSERIIIFPGKAKAQKDVSLSFRVGGPLTELRVDDGMKVLKGDLIAQIDTRDFKIRVKTLEAKLAASRAQYKEAKRQYERYGNLVKANAASKSVYDQVKAGFEMAEAQLDGDTRTLESARNALGDTGLYAPFNGYVHTVLVENHETVQQGQPVVSLVDITRMEVDISLPEALLSEAGNFTAFQCSFGALPGESYSAEIKEIGKKPNASNSSYPLTLILNKRKANGIRPGMAADVYVTLSSKKTENRFIIPVSALVNISLSETCVWILNKPKGVVEKRIVKTIGLLKGGVEIEGGVFEGEWLVTAGAHHLSEGQSVRLLEKASMTNIGKVL